MNALLLSAGFGTRFKPYTESTAKPTIPFINLPLIGYSLYYANKWSCEDIIINTHHLPKTIESCVSNLSNSIKSDIKFIHESPNILDSGGGIKNAEDHLNTDDHFLIFNTDIPHILPTLDFDKLKDQHIKKNSLVTFVTCDLENLGTKIKGLWTKENSNLIEDIGIGPKQNLICKHYTGIMLISKKLFELQPINKPHNIIYDVILPAINNGHKVNSFHLDNLNWFETGNLDSYLDASIKVANKLIDDPNGSFSTELNKLFKKFKLNNKIFSNNNYKLIYEDTFTETNPDLKMTGSVVLGKNINLSKVQSVGNSVIHSNSNLIESNYSRALLL